MGARQSESPESVVLVKALAMKMKPEFTSNQSDLVKRVGGLAETWLAEMPEGKALLACAAYITRANTRTAATMPPTVRYTYTQFILEPKWQRMTCSISLLWKRADMIGAISLARECCNAVILCGERASS